MAYLKVERKKSGSYLRILESFRNEAGNPTSKVLFSLGKVDDYTPAQLRSIGVKLFELGGGELKSLFSGEIIELGRYNYGYQQIYNYALEHYGLPALLARLEKKHKLQFSLYNSTLLMLLERLQTPCSKLSNYSHQQEYLNLPTVSLHHLYRTLDKLAKHNLLIQKQIFYTGRDLFNQKLDLVFYDVTTFYFHSEVEKEGELRQMGFGKDGKIGKTQILFCMMIDQYKNPIGYRIFKGNTFEGDTFKFALEDLKKQYQIDKVVVVADRGMLSKKNLELTIENGYEFIIGERLKSLPKNLQNQLLDISNYNNEWLYNDASGEDILIKYMTLKHDNKTIIATYSSKRAKKDKAEREEKLETAAQLLKNTTKLNTKAARFFLINTESQTYKLDEQKVKNAERFDGFLAISTNTSAITINQVLEQYKMLFNIEHSFRTFKSHLETRPMFHWTDKRIEGHICMCYIAFTIQNFILQKVNKDKKNITETTLRATLDKMQVSLIQNQGQNSYLRSMPTDLEKLIQNKLGIKPLPPIQLQENLKF